MYVLLIGCVDRGIITNLYTYLYTTVHIFVYACMCMCEYVYIDKPLTLTVIHVILRSTLYLLKGCASYIV